MKSKLSQIEIIDIPRVHDERGILAVIEEDTLPFKFKRVYYLYDVPTETYRGGHAHKQLHQLIIALSGSFDVHLHDGTEKETFTLNKPHKGLLLLPGIWREIDNFSSGAVCLVLASEVFSELDYIRDFDDFLTFKNS